MRGREVAAAQNLCLLLEVLGCIRGVEVTAAKNLVRGMLIE